MFRRTRWWLVAWNVLVFGLILLLVSVTAAFLLSRNLLATVDNNLAAQSTSTGHELLEMRDHPGIPDVHAGYQSGVFFLLASATGQVLENPQQVALRSLPPGVLQPSRPHFVTVEVNNEPLRLYVRPVLFDFSSNTVLIVGQSLSIERRTLFQQVATLGLVSAGGMLLLLGGAWFLAGRALVPIQQAFGRQQTFVADAAHELRTPLTSLRVAVELLQRHLSGVSADDDQLLQDLRAELERLERLTTDLLTLARSDLGELTLAVGEVDLAVLTSDVVRRIQRLAAEHGASVSYNGPPEILWIEGDPDRLQQLLLILLDNAFKHAPGSPVTVRLGAHGHQAQLEVEDDGPGIPSEALQQVFDRFYRADPARPTGGSGLGLAIARSLVAAHGGKIDIGSTRGRGTLVTIRLPLQRPEEMLGQSGRGAVAYVVPGARALWKHLRRSIGHAPLRSHPPSE